MPILNVFAGKDDAPAILKRSRLIERYDAFLLVEATPAAARAIGRRYPVEDITDHYRLELANVNINTSRPRVTTAGTRRHPAYGAARLRPGPHHYIVQFRGPIKDRWLARLRLTGAKLRVPQGSFSYIVRARKAMLPKIAALPFVRWLGHLPHAARIAPGLVRPIRGHAPLPRRRVRPNVYRVEIFDGRDTGAIATAARRLRFTVLLQEPKARVLVLESESSDRTRPKQIQALSAVPGVKFIRQQVVPRTANNIAIGIMDNAYAATNPAGLKLAGAGEIIGICDTGLDTGNPASIHPDFAGRVLTIKSYPITSDWKSVISNPGADDGPADLDSGHGTHVAGSVLGNGTASAGGQPLIRGHAYKAKLVFQAVEQEMKWKANAPPNVTSERYVLAGIPASLGPLFQFAYDQGARIHSNSWGGGDPGAYDDQCRQFDQFVWDHKDFCFVIAAGNDGTDTDGNGKINLQSVTSPGTAKNCVTVGACENLRPEFDSETYGEWWPHDFPVSPFKNDPMANHADQVVPFSSRGPTTDNRVKPDVVAPGTFILSTRSSKLAANNFAWAAYPPDKKHYFHMGGTSMATPLTAGAVAVLREFLRTKQSLARPSAALLKALLIAGAQRLPGTAPANTIRDNHQGLGRVNLDRSTTRPLATIDGPGLKTGGKSTLTVKVPAANKTLRIALCYSDFPGATLINNLNLIVTDPGGRRYVGNQSSSARGTLALDATSNVEVVQVTKAKTGNWTVDVVASNVSVSPQDFALAAVLV
ncbi:MAG: S8 family serine peptidase [Candidatus Rokubacteria bacterium]|nr:S8 family serine peptidase [Candidatus Rokubacteria bacterium]